MNSGIAKSEQQALLTDLAPSAVNPLMALWERWPIVAIFAFAGLIGGYIWFRTTQPIYTATCRLMATETGHAVNSDGSRPNNLFTQTSIVTSWTTITAAVANLQDPQWFWDCGYNVMVDGKPVHNEQYSFEGIRPPVEKRVPMPAGARAPFLKSLQTSDRVGDLMGAVTPTVGTQDMTISIAVESPYSEEAHILANAVADAYLNISSSQKHGSANATVVALGQEHEQLQKDLQEKNRRLTGLVRDNPTLYLSNDKNNPIQQQLDAISLAMTNANIAMIDAQRSYAAALKSLTLPPAAQTELFEKGTINGQLVVPATDEQEMKNEIHQATRQLAELRQRYLENHPSVIAARDRLDQLNAANILLLKAKMEAEHERLEAFTRSYEDASHTQQELNTRLAQYTALMEERQNSERLMTAIDTRMKEVRIDDDVSSVNVQMLAAASRPYVPTRPVRYKGLQYGFVMGAMVGLCVAFIDPRIRTVTDVSGTISLPLLSCIPRIGRKLRGRAGQMMVTQPSSNVAEAFRALRSSISRDPNAHSILVTSAAAGDGKSTVASNLAIALANLGRRVLLIDADLRDPVQHVTFPPPAGTRVTGINDVILGRTPLKSAVFATSVDGLDLLPCGTPPPNAAELIDSEGFSQMLSRAVEVYDAVVLDAPPVLPVTDARILGQLVDATVLVLRAGRTSRQTATDALSALTGYGANVVGVALNGTGGTRRAYGYYGGYASSKVGNRPPARLSLPSSKNMDLPKNGDEPLEPDQAVGKSSKQHHPVQQH